MELHDYWPLGPPGASTEAIGLPDALAVPVANDRESPLGRPVASRGPERGRDGAEPACLSCHIAQHDLWGKDRACPVASPDGFTECLQLCGWVGWGDRPVLQQERVHELFLGLKLL